MCSVEDQSKIYVLYVEYAYPFHVHPLTKLSRERNKIVDHQKGISIYYAKSKQRPLEIEMKDDCSEQCAMLLLFAENPEPDKLLKFIKAIKRNKLPSLSPTVINNVDLLYHLRLTRYGHCLYDWGGGFQMAFTEFLF